MTPQTYRVQFVLIREHTVNSLDDIQAEKDAYSLLEQNDRDAVIASCVLEDADESGAIGYDEMTCWHFAKAKFGTIDRDFLEGE